MRQADVRLRRQDEPALKHDQDLRADQPEHTRTQQAYCTFRKLLQGGNDTLRIYKEFCNPVQSSSIHFLRAKLCVARSMNGFEIIDPDTLDMQRLLDPSDESLGFVRHRCTNTRPKPVAIYRIENELLLRYDGACFASDLGTTTVADFALDRVRLLYYSRRA